MKLLQCELPTEVLGPGERFEPLASTPLPKDFPPIGVHLVSDSGAPGRDEGTSLLSRF